MRAILVLAGLVVAAPRLAAAQEVTVWPSPRAVVVVDGQAAFELVITNIGLEPAHDVVVRDTLADGAVLVDATPAPAVAGDTLTFAVGTVLPGEAARVRLVLAGGFDGGAEVEAVVAGTRRIYRAAPAFAAPAEAALQAALRPTPDADAADPEVLAFVARHGGELDRLQVAVRDDMHFEPYRGSLRGARGTLWSGAGNAFDQTSLLVAAARAAGVPAGYAAGTLDDDHARALLASTFGPANDMIQAETRDPDAWIAMLLDPEQRAAAGLPGLNRAFEAANLNAATLRARLFPDPTADPALIAEVRRHAWTRLYVDGGWSEFDPTRIEQSPAAEETFLEVPDADRHFVEVVVQGEAFNPTFGGALAENTGALLTTRLPTATLAGRPIVVRYDVREDIRSGVVFGSSEYVYTPVVELDGQVWARGSALQELISNFPGGNQLVTGLFVDADHVAPDGARRHVRHISLDRLGHAVRTPGEDDVVVPEQQFGARATVTPHHRTLIHVGTSWVPHHVAFGSAHRSYRLLDRGRRHVLVPLQDLLAAAGPQAVFDASTEALRAAADRAVAALRESAMRSAGLRYLAWVGDLARTSAVHFAVRAYAAAPRIVITEAVELDGRRADVINVARSALRVLNRPGHHAETADGFRFSFGLSEKIVEGQVLQTVNAPDTPRVSWLDITDAAAAQGVQLRSASSLTHLDFLRLGLPPDAVSRMRAALGADRLIIYPEAPVDLHGVPTFAWLEYDVASGEATVSNAQGHHMAVAEKGAISPIWRVTSGAILVNAVVGAVGGAFAAFYDAIDAKWGGGSGTANLEKQTISCLAPIKDAGTALNNAVKKMAEGGITKAIAEGIGAGFKELGWQLIKFAAATAAYCTGIITAYSLYRGLFAFYDFAADPALPAVGAVGLVTDRLFGAPHQHRAPREVPGGLAVVAPAALGDGPLTAMGSWQLEADGAWHLPAGVARLEDGRELAFAAATLEGAVIAEGVGSLTRHGAAFAGDLDLDGAFVARDLRVRDAEGWRPIGAAAGTLRADGGVRLPAELVATTTAGALWRPGEGFAGLDGALRLGPDAAFEGAATARLRLEGLPAVQPAERGQTVEIPYAVHSSTAGTFTVSVSGPPGWQVDVAEDHVRVRPAPGAAPGRHPVHVSARSTTDAHLVAGATVEIDLRPGADAVSVALIYQDLFVQHAGGLHLPLTFPATIRNRGEAPRTFALTAEAPAGFTAHLGNDAVTLRPGEQATVFLNVRPEGDLPPPGGDFTVAVTAADGPVGDRAEVTIPFPAVISVDATFEPEKVQLAPGESIEVTLRLEGLGNAPGELLLEAPNATRRVRLEGLPEGQALAPGEVVEHTLTLSAAEDAVSGLSYAAGVEVLRAGNQPQLALVAVEVAVVSPESDVFVDLARLATEIGRDDLHADFVGMADQAERIRFRCDPRDVDQLLRVLRALRADLADEVYLEVAATLDPFLAVLESRACDDVDLPALTEAVRPLIAILEGLRDHDFRLTLRPGGRLVSPGEDAPFTLDVERLGARATTVTLALEAADQQGEIDGDVESPVVPDPRVDAHPLTVRSDTVGRHRFRVVATAVEAPAVRRVVSGVLVAQDNWVEVARVGADPPFALPGAQLRLYADLLNVANVAQELTLEVEVRDPGGAVLHRNEEPIPFRLAATLGLQRVPLGRASLFDEPAGHYTVHVRVHTAATGAPTPGGAGEGVVFVGQPFDVEVALDPPLLPPGDLRPTVRIAATRRPLEALPGLGVPELIELFASNSAGPAGLAEGPDGSIYFANFGSERSSDIPGHIPGNTVGRITPFGDVEQLAVVPAAPSDLTIGPDGALYVANVGDPERISRIDLDTGAVTTWYDFEAVRPQGGGFGENVVGIRFDDQGRLYASELLEPVIFGITNPGQRVYVLEEDPPGAVTARNHIAAGFSYAASMAIDPRTQDLFVADDTRVSRLNTVGPPVITPVIQLGERGANGLAFTPEGHLLVVDGVNGDVIAYATEVVDGHTELVGEGTWVMGGLWDPIYLVVDQQGRLVTSSFDLDSVVRVHLNDDPPPAIELQVDHAPADTVDPESGQPDLGAGGPLWAGGRVTWTHDWGGDDRSATFTVAHDLRDLVPGTTVLIDQGTTLTYRHGGEEVTVTLPPTRAVVDHLVGLQPDHFAMRTGKSRTVQVALRNHAAEDDTFHLRVEGLPDGLSPVFPAAVEVPAGQEVRVDLVLTATNEAEVGGGEYVVVVETAAGRTDEVVGTFALTAEEIRIEVDPPAQEVVWGEEVAWTVTLTRPEGNDCRAGDLRTEGLAAIAANGREINTIIDYYRQPNVLVRTFRVRLTGAAGSHPVRFRLAESGFGCGGALTASATVTILDAQRITVTADPPSLETWNSFPVDGALVITNEGSEVREVTMSVCCGVLWQRTFDAGPHRLAPGATVRVPVRLSPNGAIRGASSQRFDIRDRLRPELTDSYTLPIFVHDRRGTMDLLAPRSVQASDGAARFTVRFTRPAAVPPEDFVLVVDGPITHSVEGVPEVVDMQAQTLNLPITLRDLDGLAPGPWPVRFRAWPVAQPGVVFEHFGHVTIPAGGLRGTWQPGPEVTLPGPGATGVTLQVDNLHFTDARRVDVAFRAEPPDAFTAPGTGALQLSAGGRGFVDLSVGAPEPGEYTVTATLTPDAGDPLEVPLRMVVEVPNILPVIDEVVLDPALPTEGAPVRVVVLATDESPADTLRYDFDLDGDGEWDEEGLESPEVTTVFPDDGAFVVRVAVQDPRGGRAETEIVVAVANVPPAFLSEPGLAAVERTPYTYAVQVTDPADPVTLELTEGPAGAALADGELRWTPTFEQALAGSADFTLVADDGDGGRTEQTWTVTVAIRDGLQAPQVDAVVITPEQPLEGTPFTVEIVASDPDDAPEALVFDLDPNGDGTWDQVGVADRTFELVFADQGAWPIRVAVEDPSGRRAEAAAEITVLNVPPRFTEEAPAVATEGVAYVWRPAVHDPGDDVILLALADAPEGAALQAGELRWTPTWPQALAGEADFRLTADDGDGGHAEYAWTVTVAVADGDDDGLPDTCALLYGLEGPGDDDGDGRSNAEECLRGSSPVSDGRPTAPTLLAPENDALDVDPAPVLTIEAAEDPDGDAITYAYEIRRDAPGEAMDDLEIAASADGIEALEWQPAEPLADGAYRWRARAADDAAAGPWSEIWTFQVGLDPDAGPADAGFLDAGPDGAPADAAPTDAAAGDTETDGAAPDAARADARPEDPRPDRGTGPPRDGGPDDATETTDLGAEATGGGAAADGCDCRATDRAPATALALLLLLLGLRASSRSTARGARRPSGRARCRPRRGS